MLLHATLFLFLVIAFAWKNNCAYSVSYCALHIHKARLAVEIDFERAKRFVPMQQLPRGKQELHVSDCKIVEAYIYIYIYK